MNSTPYKTFIGITLYTCLCFTFLINQTTAVNCPGWVSMVALIPGTVQSKHNCCLRWGLEKGHIKAVKFFYCVNRRMRIVWYLGWLVPHTQHTRRQVLEIHWTHFYWAPTMYTRHWPKCWWYRYSRRRNKKPSPYRAPGAYIPVKLRQENEYMEKSYKPKNISCEE